jgi:hypothetical protein
MNVRVIAGEAKPARIFAAGILRHLIQLLELISNGLPGMLVGGVILDDRPTYPLPSGQPCWER